MECYLTDLPSEIISEITGHLGRLSKIVFRYTLGEPLPKELSYVDKLSLGRYKLSFVRLFLYHRLIDESDLFHWATKNGNLKVLVWAHQHGGKSYCPTKEIMETGSIQCLKYLWDIGLKPGPKDIKVAARYGHLNMLKWLYARRLRGSENICAASLSGITKHGVPYETGFACLRFLHERGSPLNGKASALAASISLEVLKYCHERGAPLDRRAPDFAASRGRLDCLRYLHENGYPWDSGALCAASGGGHLDCLSYLVENECPWYWSVMTYTCTKGHINCLRYLHEKGYPWDERAPEEAAKEGNLHCLQYLHENGCPWNELTPSKAACDNKLECLKYALENGCPAKEDLLDECIGHGSLECLIYLYGRGYKPIGTLISNFCFIPISDNCVQCLKWLHIHDKPWDISIGVFLIRCQKPEVRMIKWAHETGMPLDKELAHVSAETGNKDIYEYLIANGCPYDKEYCEQELATDRPSDEWA